MKSVWMAGVAVIVIAVALAVAGQNRGAETLSIDGGNRGNVPFPHKLHQDTLGDCQACHDLFPMQAGAVKAAKLSGALKNKQVMNTKCIACHKETSAAGQKAGPVKCSQCHVKN